VKGRRLLIAAVALLGVGAASWWSLRPDPVEPAPDQARYEEIPRSEYEQWMQDLGYTE